MANISMTIFKGPLGGSVTYRCVACQYTSIRGVGEMALFECPRCDKPKAVEPPKTYRDAVTEGSLSCDVCRSWTAAFMRGPDGKAFGAACVPCEREWLDACSLDTWSGWVDAKRAEKQSATVAQKEPMGLFYLVPDEPPQPITPPVDKADEEREVPEEKMYVQNMELRNGQLVKAPDPSGLNALRAIYKKCSEGPQKDEVEKIEERCKEFDSELHRQVVYAEVKTVAAEKLSALKSELWAFGKGLAQRKYSAWPSCPEHGSKKLLVVLYQSGTRVGCYFKCCVDEKEAFNVPSPPSIQRAWNNSGQGVVSVSE